MADEKIVDERNMSKERNFVCGVVEGFYGRPWTTEQRKDLFAKMKKWGMDSYVYAPKDDYKHRAYWRELYTVEEAEHLTGLIQAAKEHGINFYYAISPGLDITYSSAKEVSALKRKLEQVSQFGCNAFALLFDDIEPEMSEADKEVFQSFAHAQVSVTNEMYQHLSQPAFLLCPTQYCAARAAPDVQNSEYLNTLGSKLPQEVDIMWTGAKVISRTLSIESIEEITVVLRRPPVIWDNLHANDYDPKRVFLGPYSGRSPDLIPKLRGVLTNPNCEYGANFVAIHTLAQWSRCNVDAIRDPSINDTVSADIKLETEGASEDGPCGLTPNMYHPRRALKNAIADWLPEFHKSKHAWGPITKPQQVIPTPVLIPIIPSVNTCMSVTSTTTTTSVPMGGQLQALAEVCCTVSTAVMNSLASETKIVPLEVKKTKLSNMEPMDCNQTPGNSPAHVTNPVPSEDAMVDSPSTGKSGSCTMLVEIGSDDTASSSATQMLIDSGNTSLAEENTDQVEVKNDKELTLQDLSLLCDLFYLPFEHGGFGIHLLSEFYWLRSNAHVLSQRISSPSREASNRAELEEWLSRAGTFQEMVNSFKDVFLRLNGVANRELLYELYPYVWDIVGVLSLLNSYVQWLAEGERPNPYTLYTLGNYTWFSQGWKEAFMSGDQEPWVFRGGLTADLTKLLPMDSMADLFNYRPPELPTSKLHVVRSYKEMDRPAVNALATRGEHVTDLPLGYCDLIADSRVGGFLDVNPGLCFLLDLEGDVVGYAFAAKDARQFYNDIKPYNVNMATKYAMGTNLTDRYKEIASGFLSSPEVQNEIYNQYPSVMTSFVDSSVTDDSASKILLACLLAALRSIGSSGVHVVLDREDRASVEFYSRLGFADLSAQCPQQPDLLYMGRSF